MTSDKKITQRFPSTGASPAEQTAAAAKGKKEGTGNFGMTDSDKKMYNLVENNVSLAGGKFGDNLKFNEKTLTDVLYDNIYKLLGEKFNEDEFAQKIAEELIKSGNVTQDQASSKETGKGSTGSTPVYEIDNKAYNELVSKVDAAIQLLKANKLNIFKLLNEISSALDEQEKSSGESDGKPTGQSQGQKQQGKTEQGSQKPQSQTTQKKETATAQKSEKKENQISILLNRFRGSCQKLKEYAESRAENRDKVKAAMDDAQEKSDKQSVLCRKTYGSITGTLKKLKGRVSEVNKDYKELGDSKLKSSFKVFGDFSKKGFSMFFGKKKKDKDGKEAKPGFLGKLMGKRQNKYQIGKKKPGIKDTKMWKEVSTLVKTIATTMKIVAAVAKTVFKVGKAIVKMTYKTGKFLAKAAYKTAKFAVKSFFKASKMVGRAAKAAVMGAGRVFRDAIKSRGKSLFKLPGAGKILTFVGFRMLKFVGKLIWKGVKLLAKSALNILKRMFRFVVRFANKIATYVGKFASGIADKAYMFLVKPMASFMVTVMDFTLGVVNEPVTFMKNMIPMLLERMMNLIGSIKVVARRVLESTWSLFRKILFNPISIALIIGGLFLLFGPKLIGWLTDMVTNIKEKLIPAIVKFAKETIEVLKPIWECVSTVGKWLWEIIKWVTDPDNWLVKIVWSYKKLQMAYKKFIVKMMRAAGQNTMDMLCMYIAGDYIGMAFHVIVGAVKNIWEWMIKKPGMLRCTALVLKAMAQLQWMIWQIPWRLVESIGGALWKIANGEWGDVPEAFAAPWKEWWQGIEDIFNFGTNEVPDAQQIFAKNPIEDTDEIENETSNVMRSLRMKGMNSDNVISKMDEISKTKGYVYKEGFRDRLGHMENLYKVNVSQIKEYDKFVGKLWKMVGEGSRNMGFNAKSTLEMLLSSPDFSQKILSVFYYYNPQTGETMLTRPRSAVNRFIANLSGLLSSGGNWDEKFKLFIEALDQLNMERSLIVNNQGSEIIKFGKGIRDFDLNQRNSDKKLQQMVDEFNQGNLFRNMLVDEQYFKHGISQNKQFRNVTARTGRKIGNSNPLTKISDDMIGGHDAGDFKAHPKLFGSSPHFDQVKVSDMAAPRQHLPADSDELGRSKAMVKKWDKHYDKILKAIKQKGYTEEELQGDGLDRLTYEEFMMKNLTPEQRIELKQKRAASRAGYDQGKTFQNFLNSGRLLDKNEASVLNFSGAGGVYTFGGDGVKKYVYMFSPEWKAIMKSDSRATSQEIDEMMEVDYSLAAQEEARKQEEIREEQEKQERERQRQQSILDYSAKVSGGFIEIKMGEDEVAMEDAFDEHWYELNKARTVLKLTEKECEERGLLPYTWEEWKKYYRKKHGMPEDGIKRIPYEGKKKERQIDWSTRKALSPDELKEYGLRMSDKGPVMIPMEKAMAVASSLFDAAESIHSIRDGLEVMKYGLDSETAKIKERNEKGVQVGVVNAGAQKGGSAVVNPVPAQQADSQAK